MCVMLAAVSPGECRGSVGCWISKQTPPPSKEEVSSLTYFKNPCVCDEAVIGSTVTAREVQGKF